MIPIAEPSLGEAELNNVIAAVKSGWISSKGAFIPQFEEAFARYCGTRHGVATSNGTTALHLALTALGIGSGDEVIVPTLTFIATANVVKYTGATPVFVDADEDYWCLDTSKIEAAITPRTKAIIPVHLYGHPCDMDALHRTADKHNLLIIEDAAEAHGAEYRGKRVGAFSNVACFSFFGNKIITTGEGGICLTDDDALAAKMRIFRDHGMNPTRTYWHDVIGYNYRMTNLQAAIGVAQMERIEDFIGKRREIAAWYTEGLAGLAAQRALTLHPEMDWAKNVYWLYCILVEERYGMTAERLRDELKDAGIETRPIFYPVHTMPPYHTGASFPIAERLSRTGLCLPSPNSLTREQADYIIGTIIKLSTS